MNACVLQLPQPGLKPLCIKDEPDDSNSGMSGTTSSGPKYKLSAESQRKLKEEPANSWDKVPKANEAFCMDIYKHSAAPSKANKKVDLFSGLNQTVKV